MRSKKTALLNLFVTLNDNFIAMEDSLLQKPIQQLDLSDNFKEMAYNHNFKTLQDILNWPVSVLLMHDGFTHHHFQELRNFLIPVDGAHLLKTTIS